LVDAPAAIVNVAQNRERCLVIVGRGIALESLALWIVLGSAWIQLDVAESSGTFSSRSPGTSY